MSDAIPTDAEASIYLGIGSYLSRALSRVQPYAYYLPADYTSGRRYPLLVMLHGAGGGHRDWPTHTRIRRQIARYPLICVFPEGDNGWYTNAFEGGARYEDDLIQNLLPTIQQTLPVEMPGRQWGISGLSMGGYGALKIALKYPHLFSVAASHSGALEKTRTPETHPVFGDPERDAEFRLHEDLIWLAEQALCRLPWERPRLHLDCGLQDVLIAGNRRFSDHLTFLGYHHTYAEMPGYHTWPYWNRAFRTLLPTIATELRAG